MYFLRIEKLKDVMAERPLTDRQALPYLAVTIGLFTLAAFPVEPANGPAVVSVVISTAITVLGAIYVYRRNGGPNGQEFLSRYFAIGWVVALRVIVVCVGPLALFYIMLGAAGHDSDTTQWYEVPIYALLEVAIWWRVGHHTSELAARTEKGE
ncbi:MAG: hypothetical protein AAF333_12975 [Planctomycetota bacterium]